MLPRNFTKFYNRYVVIFTSHLKFPPSSICAVRSSSSLDLKRRNGSLTGNYYSHDPVQSRTSSTNNGLRFPKHLANTTSTTNDGEDEEGSVECEEELMDDFEQDVAEGLTKRFHLKDVLYPESNDDIIKTLNECNTVQEIYKVFEQHAEKFNEQHTTQAIILFWSCMRSNVSEKMKILSPQQLETFLNHLEKVFSKMSYDEMTCCLLYLQKIEVNSDHKVMQQLLCRIINSINQDDKEKPLSALSRLAVAAHSNKDIYQFFTNKHIVPHAVKYLDKDLDAEQIRVLTICLRHLNQLVTKDVLSTYRNKVKQAIETGVITSTDIRCILKVMQFLNLPHWSQYNTSLIRTLLLLMKSEISSLSMKDLEIVIRVLQSQLEPASIIPYVKATANKLFEQCPGFDTLDCVIHFVEPNRRRELISIVENMITPETLTSSQLPQVFRILRSLKISNVDVCNKYWSAVVNLLYTDPAELETHKLFRHCHRYMYFNNNLGGTYHHKQFEETLCVLLLKDIHENLGGIVPSKFARSASFIIAYGTRTSSNDDSIPNIIMEKLEAMKSQFSLLDCLQLSRGVQIALETRLRDKMFLRMNEKLNRINKILDKCAERHLRYELSLQELSCIIRSLINRKASRKTPLFQRLVDCYKDSLDYLNSRLVRDVTFNLSATHYLMPEICEKLLDYVYDNRNFVMGDTVEKVLTCCYNTGYMPENMDVFYWCDEMIRRDFKFMNSLSIVQASLALCYYKCLSEQLISQVFTIDFIQQIEDEIKICYSKETYPERVLNQVMQLNRAVCLDYPEAQVPWFQQNYIEAQMSKLPNIRTKFHVDIKDILLLLVRDENLLKCNHVTPYGYRIDFVLHLDRDNKFLPPPKENNEFLERISKVAILLQKFDTYCESKLTSMKGGELLKLRHLEILGYKVVFIDFNKWNSMYMNMPGAKMKYLKNLLQV